jgi:hypothetical protein
MDWIMLDVIERGPEVTIRSHVSFGGPMEYLPSACVLLEVPGVGGSSMQASKFPKQPQHIGRFNQRVIVIGQDAPSGNACGVKGEKSQQGFREMMHALRIEADMRLVFIAGSTDEKIEMAEIRAMRRSMPRIMVILTPCEQILTLF